MKIPEKCDLPVEWDVCWGAVEEAKALMKHKFGTEPVRLSIHMVDQEYIEGRIVIPEMCIDPELPEDAWYIEDRLGNRVWGSVGS